MKKVILTVVILCGVWAGSQVTQMNCASAQANMSFVAVPFSNQLGFPPTNQVGFTNTLVQPTDLSTAQVGDVSILLLSLQTNVELTLPVLADMTTNATFVNLSSAGQTPGFFTPIVTIPGALLPPNGATNGVVTPPQAGVLVSLGTNTFVVSQSVFQALLALQANLQQTLPLLQLLNGTAPVPTNNVATATFGTQLQAITNFSPMHFTNNFATPLTNQSRVSPPVAVSAF